MESALFLLLSSSVIIGFLHTVFGPDHYLPFVAMSKARKWSYPKTMFITFVCGIGHVGSSILIGFIGIFFGVALFHLQDIEGVRGDVAGFSFIVVGIVYLLWALWKLYMHNGHSHHHHVKKNGKTSITPWVLFTIFVFGPCEPLIPLLFYPAARNSLFWVFVVAFTFGIVTIATMMAIVTLLLFGIRVGEHTKLFHVLEKYAHVLAGATLLLCGILIQLGL